jgi:predicted flavoprotein YhiN
VIGAGAAGLTAALRAAEAGASVRLLNAHPKVGLKILMSGGTRCNVTHRQVEARDFHGGSRHVVARILRAFPPGLTRAWFDSLGVRLVLEDTGKYFPATNEAKSVLDALLDACERAGIELWSGARVVRLERGPDAGGRGGEGAGEGGGAVDGARASAVNGEGEGASAGGAPWRIGIQTVESSAAFSAAAHAVGGREWPLPEVEPDTWLVADAVVLATGGLSFPRTGSDGAGYALAAALGHSIVPPVPALTPLTSEDPVCREAQGVTVDAELTLWADGRKAATTAGSLLITHFGYSGPAALDLSRHWQRAEGAVRRVTARWSVEHAPGHVERGETKLVPEPVSLSETEHAPGHVEVPRDLVGLRKAWAEDGHASVRAWLRAFVPERLTGLFAAEAGVEPASPKDRVTRERRETLLALLLERDLHVTGTLGYEKAEVTAGGVALDEVDPSTLESRRAPGLYLCGEILDVEGRLGGFNFQWSWSSGTVAGRAAGKQVIAQAADGS